MQLHYTVLQSQEVILRAVRGTACNGVGNNVTLQQNTCFNEISIFRHKIYRWFILRGELMNYWFNLRY